MTRLALVLAVAVCLIPSAARSAACSPLTCAPSEFTVGNGRLLAARGAPDKPVRVLDLRTGETRWRLPAGVAAGGLLVHQDAARGRLVWYDVARGMQTQAAQIPSAQDGYFTLVGVSQSGDRAVLARSDGATFAVVAPAHVQDVRLAGAGWSFDALRGSKLFLVKQLRRGYQIRLYDLVTGQLHREPLKDPQKSSTIWGSAFSRVSSSDGRYLYTLYLGSDGGAMVHILDLQDATARCVDLPGDGDYGAATTYALSASHDGRTLWAVSPGYGRVVTIDVPGHRVAGAFTFDPGNWSSGGAGMAALSPDGRQLAVTDAQHVWLVDPRTERVRRTAHVTIALGFSPDGQTIWAVGERSRVSEVVF